MVSVLASSAVDREFEARSGQTKDYKISISFLTTPLCEMIDGAIFQFKKEENDKIISTANEHVKQNQIYLELDL